jgi:flagellin
MPSIATNVAANTALSFLARNYEDQADSIARIASGKRIIKPSDDPAGLAVGTQLQADVAVLEQAALNSQQSRAVLGVADGGLASIGDILERQAVLAAQASSGTVDDTARVAINNEFQQLSAEIDSIRSGIQFNGSNLLDGSFNQNVLVGTEGTDTIAADLSLIDVSTTALGTNGTSVGTNADALAALDAVNNAINTLGSYRSNVGALQSRFSFRDQILASSIDNTKAIASAILDVNLAEEQTKLTNSRVLTEASIAGLSQAHNLSRSLISIFE